MDPQKRSALYYVTKSGRCPFEEWLEELKDVQGKAFIRARIRRLELGNLGLFRWVGKGVLELKVDHGPGYRLYFTEDGPLTVVFLCGGDKSSQNKDIERAHKYLTAYKGTK